MFTQSALRRLAASALLLMALAATPSLAQPDTSSMPADEYSDYSDHSSGREESPLMKKFQAQLAWKSLDYWTIRLNEYKSRIDRTVEPCDLAELNRLRVYWSMFLDEKKWQGVIDGFDDIFDGPRTGSAPAEMGMTEDSYSDPIAVPAEPLYTDEGVGAMPEETYETEASEAASVEIAVEGDVELMEAPPVTEEIAVDEYYSTDTSIFSEHYQEGEPSMENGAGDWTSMAPALDEVDMAKTMETVDKVSEMVETFFVAKWIARRYRPEFDKIRKSLETDITSFMDTLLVFRDNFVYENNAELAGDPDMRAHLEEVTRADMDKVLAEANDEEWAIIAYNMVIEPLLLLYNGQDLRGLLREVEALPAEITSLDIPEMSALRQNVPNPAATATTITYVLNEESRGTVLRLYNARGVMVIEENLGSRSAGEHQAVLDISDLPTGSYLYHLTVQGSRGEQVHSKTMQIVR